MARPREFDPDEALTRVMGVFWEKGYEGASMCDIEDATGLKKQSLYRAFGEKRSMYRQALAAYERRQAEALGELLAPPGAPVERISRMFDCALDAAQAGDRRGCFLCNASVDQAPVDADAAETLRCAIDRVAAALEEVLAESAPWREDAAGRRAAARRVLTGYFGLLVMAKAGFAPAALRETADAALAELNVAA